MVRFNKFKHKLSPWITNGILTSISFRDKLYHKLGKTHKDSATSDVLNDNLRKYKSILNREIRIANREYYHGLLLKYKHGLKKTWTIINTLLSRNKKTKSFPDSMGKSRAKRKLLIISKNILPRFDKKSLIQLTTPTNMITNNICRTVWIVLFHSSKKILELSTAFFQKLAVGTMAYQWS